ncbi:hypothetical protein AK830_g7172 [Neonectria ditissima]|uniref:Amine oxidase n=1 Tax=Neonectria ditissima TaxID=78410 RepID=A0A0P7BAT0_9HYPO|nr:hypothetical protein AK830_g7172 [Neonectria ditissima]
MPASVESLPAEKQELLTSTNPRQDELEAVTTDVVVVGAGLSGLQAAVKIQAAGISCHVLEANDRVGGKTLTVKSSEDHPGVNDVGAAWINDTNQSEIFQLFQRYGLQAETQRATGYSLRELEDGTTDSFPYGEDKMDDEQAVAMDKIMSTLRRSIEESNLEDPIAGPDATHLDSLAFDEYINEIVLSPITTVFANAISRSLLGVDADEVSALFVVNYFKSGTGIDNMLSDLRDGGQHLRARQGMQSISKGLAGELQPSSLHLSTTVRSIDQLAGQRCEVQSTSGAFFNCRKVIVSVPTPLYSSIQFTPPLPESKRLLSESTALGYYSKMVFVFSKPWWRDAGLSGIFDSDQGPVSFSRDTSIPADDQWSISCFLVGGTGREWSKFPKATRQEKVWNQFRRVFASMVDVVPEPINVIEMEWAKQPHFLGAPSPVMKPGVLSSVGSATLRERFLNVHFVGTETSVVWKGYMDGAVRSGQRGADEVIAGLKEASARSGQ